MSEQDVTFSITADGEITISFDPELAGEKSERYAEMAEGEKYVQGIAGFVASHVMEALRAASE